MKLIRRLPEASDAATAVAIGNFDGLHLGHQAVIAAMRRAAEAHGFIPSVLTFEPHPRRFFAPASPAFRLERLRVKLARLRDAGVERVYMPKFNAPFAALTAQAFLQEVLARQLGARAVITGENFAFGKDRSGDIATLRAWGSAHGVEIIAVPPVRFGEAICSSSAIRAELAVGDVVAAKHLLGRPYQLTGRVVHGDGRGRTIGFPTANVSLPPTLKLPAYGVYAVRVEIIDGGQPPNPLRMRGGSGWNPTRSLDGGIAPTPPDACAAARDGTLRGTVGQVYNGVANLGVKPTVSVDNRPMLEVHLFDVVQDLYGKTLTVTLVDYVRPEQKFDGVAALVAQIAADAARARIILEEQA